MKKIKVQAANHDQMFDFLTNYLEHVSNMLIAEATTESGIKVLASVTSTESDKWLLKRSFISKDEKGNGIDMTINKQQLIARTWDTYVMLQEGILTELKIIID